MNFVKRPLTRAPIVSYESLSEITFDVPAKPSTRNRVNKRTKMNEERNENESFEKSRRCKTDTFRSKLKKKILNDGSSQCTRTKSVKRIFSYVFVIPIKHNISSRMEIVSINIRRDNDVHNSAETSSTLTATVIIIYNCARVQLCFV